MRRKLDVTAADMLELREAGYSNKDIAEMLEVSVVTVRRYIGNQGKRIESVYPSGNCTEERKADLPMVQCVSQTIAVNGFLFKKEGGEVSIGCGDMWITLQAERASSLKEALAVAQGFFDNARWME